MARADELHAEREALRTLHQWHGQRRHAEQGPQRAERGIARRFEPGRRGAGRGGRDDGVIALREQLGQALDHPGQPPKHPLVLERRCGFALARAAREATPTSARARASIPAPGSCAISASITRRCHSNASSLAATSSTSSTRSPRCPASSAKASRVSSVTRSQRDVLTNANIGARGGSSAATSRYGTRARGRVSGSRSSYPTSCSASSATSSMRAREQADVIESSRELEDAMARDQAMGRLEAIRPRRTQPAG